MYFIRIKSGTFSGLSRSNNNLSVLRSVFAAEVLRAKRVCEAPWVSKNGNNPSGRENLFMTSPYERASVRLMNYILFSFVAGIISGFYRVLKANLSSRRCKTDRRSSSLIKSLVSLNEVDIVIIGRLAGKTPLSAESLTAKVEVVVLLHSVS